MSKAQQPKESPFSILLVDDNPDDRTLVERELIKAFPNLEVKHVIDMKGLNKTIEKGGYDLVITDHHLRWSTGLDVLRSVKSKEPDCPVIMFTGTGSEEIAVEAMKDGLDDYIVKAPQHFLRLSVAAHSAMKKKKTLQQVDYLSTRLQTLLNQLNVGVFSATLPGDVLEANTAFMNLLGVKSSNEPKGLNIFEYCFKSEDRAELVENMKQGGFLLEKELELHRPDGKRIWVSLTQKLSGTPDKGYVIEGIMEDITGKKIAEEAIKENLIQISKKSRYEKIISTVTRSVHSSIDLDDVFNNAVEAMSENIDGVEHVAIYLVEGTEAVMKAHSGYPDWFVERVSRIPSPKGFTWKVIKTGKPRYCADIEGDTVVGPAAKEAGTKSYVSMPIFSEGKAVGSINIHSLEKDAFDEDELRLLEIVAQQIETAINNAKQAEALRQSEERYRLLLETTNVIPWEADAKTWKFTYVGPQAVKILGYPLKKWKEKDFWPSHIHSEDRDKAMEFCLKASQSRKEYEFEYRMVTKGGEIIWIHDLVTVVYKSGVPTTLRGFMIDMTERKKLETQLLRTQRLDSLGTLAGGIAHDLNNVLTPILMSIGQLKPKLSDKSSKVMLSLLESNAVRGAEVVKQLLTFARGVEGEKVVVHPKYLIQEIEKIVRGTFPKSINIFANYPNEAWSIAVDTTQIHQVLLNLCVNSRDAMPSGGMLRLMTSNVTLDEGASGLHPEAEPGQYLMFTVSDTGHGIPPEIQDRIFEPFFTTKEVGKGTGLGLSSVSGIVRSHDGFIEVQSELNEGTTFNIYIPASSVEEESLEEETRKELAPRGEGKTVMIVDDELTFREVVRSTLEAKGYRVITANDGAEAIALFAENKKEVEVVVTDMIMPYMDRTSTIRSLRKIEPNVKVIATSSINIDKIITSSKGMDIQAFLEKPYKAELLLNTLSKLMGP